jgi:hypothetical protein
MGTLYEALARATDSLCYDFDQGDFVPLLEADVAAYLYHHLILASLPMKKIHLDTRITSIPQFKYDLVVGPVEPSPKAQRAAIYEPQIAVQIKLFPRWGFTDQQHRVHYQHVIQDDIPSFEPVSAGFPSCICYELLADFHSRDLQGYLQGQDQSTQSSRISRIREAAAKSRISVGWLHPENRSKTMVTWWMVE